ncbi:hypothetical protein AGMMS49975_29550 [Clostridia bacterium]|nr:hypothetical protein AGMMS49975_29550 [Clostridia bacterium]
MRIFKIFSLITVLAAALAGCAEQQAEQSASAYYMEESKAQYRRIAETYANIDAIFDRNSFDFHYLQRTPKTR